MTNETARVGTAILVFDGRGRVLLARRSGRHSGHAAGVYGTPGGKLDRGDTVEGGMQREAMEELGRPVAGLRVIPLVTNEPYADAHYVCFWAVADVDSGGRDALDFVEVNDRGVPKIEGRWTFFPPAEALRLPLMPGVRQAIEYHLAGRTDFVIVEASP